MRGVSVVTGAGLGSFFGFSALAAFRLGGFEWTTRGGTGLVGNATGFSGASTVILISRTGVGACCICVIAKYSTARCSATTVATMVTRSRESCVAEQLNAEGEILTGAII
jgi:hypothetical protein